MRILLPALQEMQQEFQLRAQFLIVYIQEAHAQDQWPISSGRANPGKQPVLYNQPTRLEQRIAIAQDFTRNLAPQIPMVIDQMSNDFEKAYCPWPMRLYVLMNGKVAFIAGANDWMPELRDAVELCLKSTAERRSSPSS